MKPRERTTHGIFASQSRAEAAFPLRSAQALEVRLLRCPQNLHPFLGEISVETGQRETGTIDGWFSNSASEATTSALQSELQLLGVTLKNASAVTTGTFIRCALFGTYGLHDRSLRVHVHGSFIANCRLSQPVRLAGFNLARQN